MKNNIYQIKLILPTKTLFKCVMQPQQKNYDSKYFFISIKIKKHQNIYNNSNTLSKLHVPNKIEQTCDIK